MPSFGLCALAGAYVLLLVRELPGTIPLACLAVVSLGATLVPQTRLVGAALTGFTVLAFASQVVIDDRLSAELAGETITTDVRIADFPKKNGASLSFLAEPLDRSDLPGRIRVSWFEPTVTPALGEVWQLRLRLRQARGFSNPGGFDYEGWLFLQRIGATAYVVNDPRNIRRDDRPVDRVTRVRRRFVARVRAILPDDAASAVLMAVGIGARQWITREQWQRYAVTGTSHLMAISGLHIGLAAGGIFLLAWLALAMLHRNANIRDRAALAAVAAAFLYAEVSGFAVPARRALLMAVIIVIASLLRRQVPVSRLLAISGLGILMSDPLAILSPGFKLSFAAVAILFWHLRVTQVHAPVGRNSAATAPLNKLLRLSRIQLALLFGLFPLTALLFGRLAVVAPIVNLAAIPVFNFLTVPAALLGLILDGPAEPAGDFLLAVAHKSVCFVLWFVDFAATLPIANFHIARPEGFMMAAMLLPMLWSLLPPGFPARKLALLAALALLLYRVPPPPEDCLDLHVLDVGQGLALFVRTHRHTAVFDAGPSFRGGNDTGRMVLIPFLRSKGIGSLDLLIVSHADQDHAGGVQSLTEEIETRRILSGEALDGLQQPPDPCETTDKWTWDGIDFRIVHPSDAGYWTGNNASCVLEIRVADHRLLLTGDIESPVESLLARAGVLSPSDIILVPHHGSRTSSSDRFVSTLRPKLAIVSAGFGNRWGFPKQDVVAAWRNAGAEVLNTASSGTISYRVCRDTGIERLGLHRQTAHKYWH